MKMQITCNLQLLQMPHFGILRALGMESGHCWIKVYIFDRCICKPQNPNPNNTCGIKTIIFCRKCVMHKFQNMAGTFPPNILHHKPTNTYIH